MREPERPMRQDGRHSYELAPDHLMRARYYAEIASVGRSPDGAVAHLLMASMHYLGFLAETEWSKNPDNDRELPL